MSFMILKRMTETCEKKAVGICNQRETTLVWDRKTGEPLYNAIVWSDTRTDNLVKELLKKQQDLNVQELCGLPIHNYFSAVKLKWLIERVPKVKQAVEKRRAMFGTVDTWLIWVNKNIERELTSKAYIKREFDRWNPRRQIHYRRDKCKSYDVYELEDVSMGSTSARVSKTGSFGVTSANLLSVAFLKFLITCYQ